MPNTFLLKKSFHTNLCKQLVEDIQLKRSSYFYFLGKITDDAFGVIDDTEKSEIDTRSEMIYFLKVNSSDVSYTTKRIDWVSEVVYDQYDSTIDMSDLNFYVMTNDFNVYKCLDNNQGAVSRDKPTSVDNVPERMLNDGYLWKFMYTIPLYKRNKFLSELKMPVQTAFSDYFYSFGSISSVAVLNGGSGYSPTETNSIVVSGNGTGAELYPIIDSFGIIYGVEIVNPGTGYTHATAVVQSGTGDGAELEIIFGSNDYESSQSIVEQTAISGEICNIVITNGGSEYTTASVVITGDGTGAAAEVVIENNSITKINIISYGIDYTFANIEITTTDQDRTGAAITATAYAILPPLGGHGKNAVEELNATGVCLYSNIRTNNDYGSDTLSQDFREYGIINNLRDIYTNNVIYNLSGTFSYKVTFDTVVGLVIDEILVSDTGQKYRVIDIINTDVIITSITNDKIILNQQLSALNNLTRQYVVSEILVSPTGNKYTGQMLFVSNSSAFTFSSEQEITIKTYLNL